MLVLRVAVWIWKSYHDLFLPFVTFNSTSLSCTLNKLFIRAVTSDTDHWEKVSVPNYTNIPCIDTLY